MAAGGMAKDKLESLVLQLFEVGAVKFGEFKLKSGIISPVYVDLRVLVSVPPLLDLVAEALVAATSSCTYDLVCGVPLTALPFATLMSAKTGKPMLMRRKEVKAYGTKKAIEGVYTAGQTCLIVEDLVTSGLSVFETVAPLETEGLTVNDVVVLLDRGQGGRTNVETRGKALYSVTTLPEVLQILHTAGKVDDATRERVLQFIEANQVVVKQDDGGVYSAAKSDAPKAPAEHTFAERAKVSTNPAGRALFEIMEAKQSNLCVAADVTTSAELLALAGAVGKYICCLKTHCDVVSDWTAETAAGLRSLAQEHNFCIFEDRKFADIGNTVVHQCRDGYHQIAGWADFVNAHPLPGAGIVDGLKTAFEKAPKAGLLLLGQMSTKGNLITDAYTAATVEMAEANPDFVFGFISQKRLRNASGPDPFIYMTPGVKMEQGGDAMGQQYRTPESVVVGDGCDVIIVGRGVYAAADPATAAQEYATAGWSAYNKRMNSPK